MCVDQADQLWADPRQGRPERSDSCFQFVLKPWRTAESLMPHPHPAPLIFQTKTFSQSLKFKSIARMQGQPSSLETSHWQQEPRAQGLSGRRVSPGSTFSSPPPTQSCGITHHPPSLWNIILWRLEFVSVAAASCFPPALCIMSSSVNVHVFTCSFLVFKVEIIDTSFPLNGSFRHFSKYFPVSSIKTCRRHWF